MRTLGTKPVDPDRPDGPHDLDNTVLDGIESVRQRVHQRVRFWSGTWFLDTNAGVPYLRDVLGHQISLPLATSAITRAIRGVPDVTGVSDVESRIEAAERRLYYSATVQTVFGDMPVESTL